MRRSIVCVVIAMAAASGCGPTWKSEVEELAYLEAQENPSPAQAQRREELRAAKAARLRAMEQDAAMKRARQHIRTATAMQGRDEWGDAATEWELAIEELAEFPDDPARAEAVAGRDAARIKAGLPAIK